MLKRIKNEMRVTIWPKPKKALQELGVVTVVSLFIMFIVMFMDTGWETLISLILR